MCYQAPTLIAAILRQLSLSILFILIASCHRDEEPVAARHSGEEPITARRLYTVPANLQPEDFQTSVDRELTGKINAFTENGWPKEIIDLYYGEWKDKLTINLSNVTKFRVNENQYPWLYDIVSQTSTALGINPPVTYVVQDPRPNAYVTNVKNPILVIHSELIRLLNREELFFVISHELGHIKSGHVLTLEIVSTALYVLDNVPLLNRLAPLSFLLWSKEAEISADRLGLLLVQKEGVCSRALIKLVAGLTESEGGEINVEEFLRQKAEVETDAFALRRIPILLAEATSTHPFVGTRVMKLAEFKNSEQFAKLLRSDKTAKIEIRLH